MSIQELSIKLKWMFRNTEYRLAGLIVIVALTSFALGRLSDGNTAFISEITPITNTTASIMGQNTATTPSNISSEIQDQAIATSEQGKYVASKNGTKYHLPWCGSAKSIKEENKIWFATKAEAEKAGYTPAANCKGI